MRVMAALPVTNIRRARQVEINLNLNQPQSKELTT
jgi:hypothetical protein